jgi:hypothetical protein
MDWGIMDRAGTERAWGADWTYVVTRTETCVHLARFPAESAVLLLAVAAVMRNVIVFPLGRGPGRPGGEPEMAALVASAKTYAERFEAGEGLEGYPAWQHERPAAREGGPEPAVPKYDPELPGGGVAWRRAHGLSW